MNNAPRPAPGGVFVQFAGEGSDEGAAETSAKGSELKKPKTRHCKSS